MGTTKSAEIVDIRVQGLFLDYDGTISPLDVPREQSVVPAEINAVLSQINRLIPIGIITSKEMSFVNPRTHFARAWGAIVGLEIKIGNEILVDPCLENDLTSITAALKYAKRFDETLFVEEKRDSKGRTVAFCVDWRQSQSKRTAEDTARSVLDYCRGLSLYIATYEHQPFFDVYPCSIDKGNALTKLKQALGLECGILYMGDSIMDNPAFQIADIGIGVFKDKPLHDLDCDYYLKFENVAGFLKSLMRNSLCFVSRAPGIIVK